MSRSLLQLTPSSPWRAHSEQWGAQTSLLYVFKARVMFTLLLNEGLGVHGPLYLGQHRNGLQWNFSLHRALFPILTKMRFPSCLIAAVGAGNGFSLSATLSGTSSLLWAPLPYNAGGMLAAPCSAWPPSPQDREGKCPPLFPPPQRHGRAVPWDSQRQDLLLLRRLLLPSSPRFPRKLSALLLAPARAGGREAGEREEEIPGRLRGAGKPSWRKTNRPNKLPKGWRTKGRDFQSVRTPC